MISNKQIRNFAAGNMATVIFRLNSGNFEIFQPSEFQSILVAQ